jgi:BMFP domain-containing protein YqiC
MKETDPKALNAKIDALMARIDALEAKLSEDED